MYKTIFLYAYVSNDAGQKIHEHYLIQRISIFKRSIKIIKDKIIEIEKEHPYSTVMVRQCNRI